MGKRLSILFLIAFCIPAWAAAEKRTFSFYQIAFDVDSDYSVETFKDSVLIRWKNGCFVSVKVYTSGKRFTASEALKRFDSRSDPQADGDTFAKAHYMISDRGIVTVMNERLFVKNRTIYLITANTDYWAWEKHFTEIDAVLESFRLDRKGKTPKGKLTLFEKAF